ncbi:hypothetical protein BN77_3287 [Rhizobium mesoamericanum STM3625]|uniref:Uncharacterized protein n=1 Tax=Rhizobium mesoamericanum STM3625 TaxID=1211777 RepID=K0PHX3_9HYPH|nr:hypothetical protein BN77_3287 [Rhizobium mesoamericanum STM3625]
MIHVYRLCVRRLEMKANVDTSVERYIGIHYAVFVRAKGQPTTTSQRLTIADPPQATRCAET